MSGGLEAQLGIGEEEANPEQKKIIEQAIEKRWKKVMSHHRIVKSAAYSFIEWEEGYERTKEEEEAWDDA